MHRREVLKGGVALSALALLPASVRAATSVPALQPRSSWRTFEVTTRLELPGGERAMAWIPLPSVTDDAWIRPATMGWSTNAATATVRDVGMSGAKLLHVHWSWTSAIPVVELRTRIATRDWVVDLSTPGSPRTLSDAERSRYLAGTPFVPVDGIVRQTADGLIADVRGDVGKVRRIYDWVVHNTYRDADAPGCGTGNVAAMLASGRLGGKCADLNALFVALVRAAGIPARELYGVRVAPSALGYRSLGSRAGDITSEQHCRAEVHLSGFGWVPMDPADVRKVILDEPGGLKLGDAKVEVVRRLLFGAWETNWVAYNDLRDVTLPGSLGPSIPFLMYPQAEIAGQRLDCLDADAFKYRITSREIST
ncbi:MAG TPA: transglutaminase family protein [Alphaproteobacteria bacterium]|nr:transglutaminase family protein [Alphaproteobacteria bacterium]